ncbi:MAG: 6-phosphofructokinase [Bacilli bacterium]|jgi:6-phosphofructokinase 1
MIKKIGVLTSGGDSPGMNAAVRAVIRAGIKQGCEMYAIFEGYKGLVEGKIKKVDRSFVSGIVQRGGTVLHSARLREFKEEETRKIGIAQLKKHGIEALVVIGGDGTYLGAKKLTEMGVNCIGLPGTIDNDIASTDYTIGFDTCLNTICYCVDKLRDTTESHQRCSIIEVMGNKCGDLALFSGIAEGAEMIITNDHPIPEAEIMKTLSELKQKKKKHDAMIIVSENVFDDIKEFAKRVTDETGFEARAEVLGHLQRGGSPSAFDRILAARMGVYAIDLLLDGKGGVCIGIVNNHLVYYDIYEALQLPRNKHISLLEIINTLK